MRTLTVPQSRIYIGEGVLVVEWHGAEHYRANFDTDEGNQRAVFAELLAIRDEAKLLEDASIDDVPDGVKAVVESLGFALYKRNDNSNDDERERVGRGIA